MTDTITREQLRALDDPSTHKCPICGAKPKKECNGFGVHHERVLYARNVMIREIYNGR